jgi:NAD(P)-dependent dehydrogenase (short-subunit alcohol dehydrogenase family)
MGCLEGRKALITGASKGIGRAIAVAFARQGAQMVLTARSTNSLADVIEDVKKIGAEATPMAWDVTEFGRADEQLRAAAEAMGGLDILVNNAGVVRLPEDHPNPTAEASWDYIFDANLKGLYFLSEAAGEMLKASGGGVIVNLASDAGLRAAPNAYCISKWGVVGYTKGLAKKLAGEGVRVNAVAPGPVATQMMRCEDGKAREAPNLPLGRFSLPEEVADVAVFLASDASRAIFGETIVVNSGN